MRQRKVEEQIKSVATLIQTTREEINGRLGEVEKRIANPEQLQPNAQPVRILDLRVELAALARAIREEFARYQSGQHVSVPPLREQILELTRELEAE